MTLRKYGATTAPGPRVGVLGNLNIDLILRHATALPAWGQEVEARSHLVASAGQAGYLAMALGKLGVDVDLAGRVGDDPYGRQILADLARCDVATQNVEVSASLPTGITVAVVREDGERAFVSDFGATREAGAEWLARQLERLSSCPVVCLVALFNLRGVPLDDAHRFLSSLRAAGTVTVLDTGWDPDGWSSATVEATRSLLAEVDVFLPNMDECRALLGETTDAADAARRLQQLGPRSVVIKCGSAGSYGREGDLAVAVPAIEVDAIDAVGAGDTFDAGFLCARAHGHGLEDAMRFGAATATHYLGREKDRFPSYDDVLAVLGAYNDDQAGARSQ